jgi:circadian clock protein KaiC
MGGPGSGKTVFALQTLVNGARISKDAGLFVAFEEDTQHVITNAGSFGWDLPELIRKKLFFLDARLSPDTVKAGDFDLVGILDALSVKAKELNAKRIVFDGIDVLLGLLDDPASERREIYRIRDWLAATGLTGIITQKVGSRTVDDRYAFLQFMVDCVVTLGHKVMEGTAFRNLRVVKYRGSGFEGDELPMALTAEGVQVLHRGPVELQYRVTDERVSTGLPRLDHMLHGGIHRGSNVLISGAPGTAKSTLAGLFVVAACERGERALYVSFDEAAPQLVRNLASVGVRLAPHQKSGLLQIYSTRSRGPNIEDQFGELRRKIAAHKPRCLVIDPISALSMNIVHAPSAYATVQFLDEQKAAGITVMTTSLMGESGDEAEAGSLSASVDTWIHVSYVVSDGERNRALAIVKSRGTDHSNQVRELRLSSEGVLLTDVFVAQGRVLMGVARWQREQEELAAKARSQVATEHKRLELEVAQADALLRRQVVQAEIEARDAEIAVLAAATGEASKLRVTDRAVLRKMRHADEDGRTGKRNGLNGR